MGAIGADDQFVPLSRRSAAVVALILASLAGLVATRAAVAQEDRTRASAQSVPPLSTVRRSDSAPRTTYRTQAGRPGDQDSQASVDISVAVPVVPRLQALPGLCTAFVGTAEHAKNGYAFEMLIGATGGNAAATTAWCETYLTLWQEGKTGER